MNRFIWVLASTGADALEMRVDSARGNKARRSEAIEMMRTTWLMLEAMVSSTGEERRLANGGRDWKRTW